MSKNINIKELNKSVRDKSRRDRSIRDEMNEEEDITLGLGRHNITPELVESIKEQVQLSEEEKEYLDWASKISPVLHARTIAEGGILSAEGKVDMKDRREAFEKKAQCNVVIETLSENGRSDAPIISVTVDLPEGVFNPKAGDVLFICPENNGNVLERLREIFNDIPEDNLKNLVTYKTSIDLLRSTKEKIKVEKNLSNKTAIYHLNFLIDLYKTDPELTENILKKTHLLDVLESFPNIISFVETQKLQGDYSIQKDARPYTISSIKRDEKNVPIALELCIASSTYKVCEYTFGKGKKYDGVCVTTLKSFKDQTNKQLKCYVQPRAFGNPVKGAVDKDLTDGEKEILKKPIILIGAGTGISGLRAILQERALLKERGVEVGQAILVFGMRNKETDYLYEDELKQYEQQGIIGKIIEAQSRPLDGTKKQYVQDVVPQLKEQLKDLPEGKIYLATCGDSKMGEQLVDSVVKCIAGNNKMDLSVSNAISNKYEGQNVDDKGCFLLRTTSGTNHEKLLSFDEAEKIKLSLVKSVVNPDLLPKGTNLGNLKLLKTLLENRIFLNNPKECKEAIKYLEEGFRSIQPHMIKPTSVTQLYNYAAKTIEIKEESKTVNHKRKPQLLSAII